MMSLKGIEVALNQIEHHSKMQQINKSKLEQEAVNNRKAAVLRTFQEVMGLKKSSVNS
ncbi:hypothetical protein [Bacillus weihaiensis]|uniref:hypothetical protein n=1 Tax=Bacillus weihaiensis TaxID=1547283 RepID=UPI00235433D5|nr:hypothetical protein [Bacillus weihaiensis]